MRKYSELSSKERLMITRSRSYLSEFEGLIEHHVQVHVLGAPHGFTAELVQDAWFPDYRKQIAGLKASIFKNEFPDTVTEIETFSFAIESALKELKARLLKMSS
jgi:hypothetical protein